MKQILLTLSLYFVLSAVSAQPNKSTPFSQTIDSIATHEQWWAEIPGFAVGVVMNNQVIFEKAYGVQSLESPKPLSNRSDFHMASVSKPFASTAILQLVESGKINLDSTLLYYLPYFKMKDERYKQIRIYHILTHSSGIPDVTNYEWENPQTDNGAAERYVKSFAQSDLDFTPGTQFNYSNAAFDILADVIAKASGMPFEEYIHKNIFVPAGMTHSSFLLSAISPEYRTAPHIIGDSLMQKVSNVYPYNRVHAPSSTLHSNLEDMLKWATLNLNKGTINGHQIITETTWANMTHPRLKASEEYTVCLSWFEAKIGEKIIYFHTGGDVGYRTFVGFDPEDNVAVVLMGNNDLFDAGEPGFAIFKSILLHAPVPQVPKPIYLKLNNYILKDGISKTKEVYFSEKKLHPDIYDFSGNAVLPLADLLYERGYTQQSIDVLIFCSEIDPHNALFPEYLGDVYGIMVEKQKAAEWYRKALAIDPSKKEVEQKIIALGL